MPNAADDRDQWLALLRSDIDRFNRERDALGRARISLREADLAGLDLSEAHLPPADLTRANLRDCRLPSLVTHCRLEGTDLSATQGPDAAKAQRLALLWSNPSEFNRRRESVDIFEMADLSDGDLRDADLTRVQFFSSDLCGADLSRCKINDTNLQNSSAIGARFAKNQSESLDATGANLTRADFSGAELRHARLNSATLDDAAFENAVLIAGGLAQARGQRINFRGATIRSVNVNALVAPAAVFAGAKLIRLDFAGGDLRGADFRGATFERVTFDDVDLTDVDFRGTDTSAIEFGYVTNRDKASF